MTNKEAIAELKAMPIIYPITNGENDRASRLMQARDMAIKALKQEPCEDAISRQAVKELYYKDGYIDFRKICELPPVNPQPCEDAISRQAVLDIVDSYSESQSNVEDVTQDIISDIIALPPVNPQPKMGRWIYGEDNLGTGRDGWYCNRCGHFEFWDYSSDVKTAKLNLPNPCPSCGAKMVKPQERNDKE